MKRRVWWQRRLRWFGSRCFVTFQMCNTVSFSHHVVADTAFPPLCSCLSLSHVHFVVVVVVASLFLLHVFFHCSYSLINDLCFGVITLSAPSMDPDCPDDSSIINDHCVIPADKMSPLEILPTCTDPFTLWVTIDICCLFVRTRWSIVCSLCMIVLEWQHVAALLRLLVGIFLYLHPHPWAFFLFPSPFDPMQHHVLMYLVWISCILTQER